MPSSRSNPHPSAQRHLTLTPAAPPTRTPPTALTPAPPSSTTTTPDTPPPALSTRSRSRAGTQPQPLSTPPSPTPSLEPHSSTMPATPNHNPTFHPTIPSPPQRHEDKGPWLVQIGDRQFWLSTVEPVDADTNTNRSHDSEATMTTTSEKRRKWDTAQASRRRGRRDSSRKMRAIAKPRARPKMRKLRTEGGEVVSYFSNLG